ncbi:2-keto-3-deoxygluconate permease [Corynebacterium comes]|uniref:2-keto-3-deoxygluconate permease n=1 Tax=Corynebacterium comes TaxID=2675218 RepID=A0A6B8VGW2_9CORY|nr:2-keto-3-deoxygluconate permease [Corynebacterium comes]QGU03403.1 2-keto-3-deoxygluconate permease [Corynebacterium comes]
MDAVFRAIGKIPGALMVVPLFLGAIMNTFFPDVLDIGAFTTALFRDGAPVLIGLFFVAVGSQISFRTALPSLEKGLTLVLAKYGAAVAVGVSIAFLSPSGTLWGLLPLAVIAAMSNSNGSLYVALTSQFGSKTDKGAISVLSINDGPFLTMLAMGAAGLAQLPMMALFAAIFPMILGFILGNSSEQARAFLAPGEKLIIPFAAFALGAGIDFRVLVGSGAIGILLGLLTVIVSGGLAIAAVYLWHRLRRHPKPTRNVLSGAAESAVAGNAIATPAAIVAVDPSLASIQAEATAQVAAAVVVTAFISPFLVSWISKRQIGKGITKEAENLYFEDPARFEEVWEVDQSLRASAITEAPVEPESDLSRRVQAKKGSVS